MCACSFVVAVLPCCWLSSSVRLYPKCKYYQLDRKNGRSCHLSAIMCVCTCVPFLTCSPCFCTPSISSVLLYSSSCTCVVVRVFIRVSSPSILDASLHLSVHVGGSARIVTQEERHTQKVFIFYFPPSFCGACL